MSDGEVNNDKENYFHLEIKSSLCEKFEVNDFNDENSFLDQKAEKNSISAFWGK